MLKKQQVYQKLLDSIATGELPPGSKLPSGIELAKQFNVSHITMRSALRELALAGQIKVVQGRGIFVLSNTGTARIRPKILAIRINHNIEMQFGYIFPEFTKRCGELGGEVTEISQSFLRENRPLHLVNQLRAEGYTGMLLDGSAYRGDEPELEIIKRLKIPALIAGGDPEDAAATGLPVLSCDQASAWKCGMEFLTGQGYRRIAILLCPKKSNVLRGYAPAEHAELPPLCGAERHPELLKMCLNVSEPGGEENIFRTVRELMDGGTRPDAIYCYSDFVALVVYRALREMKLKIPDDVAVMGFCGFPGAELLSPPLSTIDLDYAGRGRKAAEMLCSPETWFKPGEPFRSAIFTPCRLLRRGSVKIAARDTVTAVD